MSASQLNGYWKSQKKETQDDIKGHEKIIFELIASELPKEQVDNLLKSRGDEERAAYAQKNLGLGVCSI